MRLHGLVRILIAVAAAWGSIVRIAERAWGGMSNRILQDSLPWGRNKDLDLLYQRELDSNET